ncbi:MAG: aquaporin Z [Gemmatimonadaceae bacterium]|nr:aquaporin Z [Acetobacteraceae bacterium]
MTSTQRLSAELLGTFWLVFGGCGSAILAAAFPALGIGFTGVSLAFGLTVLTMAYGVGYLSGAHFNPAITIGLAAAGRFPAKDVPGYVIAQVIGAVLAAAVLYLIATGKPGFETAGFASNGYGDLSPGKYSLLACLVTEIVCTFFFLMIIMGVKSSRVPDGFGPLPIGLALTLIHLISIPVTNTSVNPARSTGQALFGGGAYIGQLWLFWLAPIAGAVLAAVVARVMHHPESPPVSDANLR